MKSLQREAWRCSLEMQVQRVRILLQGNRLQEKTHPIYNFISSYYHFKHEILFQYSPGIDTSMHVIDESDFMHLSTRGRKGGDLVYYDPSSLIFSRSQLEAFKKAHRILISTHNRAPSLNCFGLHEWAMLYNEGPSIELRQELPLRVSREDIRHVVLSNRLRCSHFDAFRFFTKNSIPLNDLHLVPSRENQDILDQPGCLHVHMDLFKWSFKIFPFLPSELLIDALDLAIQARELDMRASPYDLRAHASLGELFSSEPVMIEKPEGRREYQRLQLKLYAASIPIRKKLISSYELFLSKVTSIN